MSTGSAGSPVSRPPSTLGWRVASRTIGLTRPLAGHRAFPLWGVVRHRGRRSGRELSVPVVVRPVPGGVVVPLPWGPKTNWVRNVLAAGECTILWKGTERRLGRPKVIDGATAQAAFGGFQRAVMARLGLETCLSLRFL
ncbi:hypothetical protein [Segeticoccus rhizosphaerae]|uniref:hypothetical protein n=1 Tax=Segeticoccus rhizosphaerae TaxID=1104777 RepID=UPI0010BFE360|nr:MULTISPECIES: hypothetical protein [Intrasporangiaceae]